jgi:hypothetical protein
VAAREAALAAIRPIMEQVTAEIGEDRVRAALPVLREIRTRFSQE